MSVLQENGIRGFGAASDNQRDLEYQGQGQGPESIGPAVFPDGGIAQGPQVSPDNDGYAQAVLDNGPLVWACFIRYYINPWAEDCA